MSLQDLEFFLDVGIELEKIRKEAAVMDRKWKRLAQVTDLEDEDSHFCRIADCIEYIYSGMEAALKKIITALDGGSFASDNWHKQLLERCRVENSNIRPVVIDEETFELLDELRAFRHRHRHNYGSTIRPEKIVENMQLAMKAIPRFLENIEVLRTTLETENTPVTGIDL